MILAFLLCGGLLFAIQPAESWTAGTQGKFLAAGQANVTTEGGNVTPLDLSSNISTEKWAGYWGNVTGEIVLAPGLGAPLFYSWTWDSGDGGEVCAVAAASGFDWSGLQGTSAAAIDGIWNFGAATDNATETFNETCSIEIAGFSIPTTDGSFTGQRVDFMTCVLADQASPADKSDLAFCVDITQDGGLFNTFTGDYELLAPANETAGATETHYFWLELD